MSGILAQLSSVATKVLDPLWEYVTLLLHGDGTNGAQNNTFLDSSTNNFTITRNGNTTQGTFTPYGANWSNYFSSNAYITTTGGTATAMGLGDFTWELWVNVPASGLYQTFIENRSNQATGSTDGFYFGLNTGTLTPIVYTTSLVLSSSVALTVNTWNHVALVRSAGTLQIWINGASGGTVSNSTNLTSQPVYFGNSTGTSLALTGHISNVRMVKGTAVYTAAFTPSTIPLTAISGTSLLTCQSNRFIDNSSNAFTITRSGSPAIQHFSPFNLYSQYRDKTIGGSGYFDGTGDYLNFTDTSNVMDLGGATASFEAWIYPTAATCVLMTKYGGATTYSITNGIEYTIALVSQQFLMYYNVAGTFGTLADPTTGRALNQWYHIVVASNTTTLSLYVNGTRVVTATAGITKPTTRTTVRFGLDSATTYLNGYLSDVRFIQGTGAYDASQTTITIPTAPLTAVTNTSLLLSYTNAGIYDNTSMNILETVGNAQVSNTKSKFGGTSLYFDGTGDYLTIPAQQNYNFGTGSFTIEFWINYTSVTTYAGLFDSRAAGGTTANWAIGLYTVSATNRIDFIYGTTRLTTTSAITANTWTHVAIVRSGGVIKVYINGTADATTATSSVAIDAGSSTVWIGAAKDPYYLNGYLDDFRITKGVARYTTNFSVPTQSFINQ